jgi:hypothetical protein
MSASHIDAWLAYEAEEKPVMDNDLDRFRSMVYRAAAGAEATAAAAAAVVTPELCALRDCDGRHALEICIDNGVPLSVIQRILEIAPELAREKSCLGYTMLQELFRVGHVERDAIVPLLLAAYPEGISVKGLFSEIPIFTMVRRRPDLAMFRVLHAAAEAIGFDDLAARDVNGDTLLHLAVTCSFEIAVTIVGIRRTTRDAVNLRGLRPVHSFCFSEEAEFSENNALLIFHNIYDPWVPLLEKVEHPDLYDCGFIQRSLNNWSLHNSIKQWLIDEHPDWCDCASIPFEKQLEQQRIIQAVGGGRL